MVARRFGVNGKSPETLETIGLDYSITRERVRQIEKNFINKLSRRKPIWTPILDKVIDLINANPLITAKKLQEELISKQLSENYFSIDSLVKIAKLFQKDLKYSFDNKKNVLATKGYLDLSKQIIDVSVQILNHRGATTIGEVQLTLKDKGITLDAATIKLILEATTDFMWIDKTTDWFWMQRSNNRVLHYVEKIMSVAGSIDVEDLRNGTGRPNRAHGIRLPRKILINLCLATGLYTLSESGDRLKGGNNLPDWKDTLNEGEKTIVKILFDNKFVMRRSDLEKEALNAGMNINSFYIYLSYSPVIIKYTMGVFGLRGAPVSAAQIKVLIPPIFKYNKIIRNSGWTNSGNVWIGYQLSNSSILSGVLSLPSAYKNIIFGSFNLISEAGQSMGRLIIGGNHSMWGLSHFLRRWEVEAKDFLVIEFNISKKIVTIYAGDKELLSRFQEDNQRASLNQVLGNYDAEQSLISENNDVKDQQKMSLDIDEGQIIKEQFSNINNETNMKVIEKSALIAAESMINTPLIESPLPSRKRPKEMQKTNEDKWVLISEVILSTRRSLVISRKSNKFFWINEKINSTNFKGFTHKGFGFGFNIYEEVLSSLTSAINSSDFENYILISPSLKLVIHNPDNETVDIRYYKTTRRYTGYIKRGIRLSKPSTKIFLNELRKIQ